MNYEELKRRDIIEKIQPAIKAGIISCRTPDGVFVPTYKEAVDSPWIHIKMYSGNNCSLWQGIFFNYYGLLPLGCMDCYKVVVRPRSLDELMALKKIQEHLDLPSKLGIEKREYTCGLYGGYFYNHGVEAGRVCYKIVRKHVSEVISPDVKVILKHGCTEMEMKFGASDKWEDCIQPDQEGYEKYIKSWFEMPSTEFLNTLQPEPIKTKVYMSWIEWAYAHADMTYLNYTDGKPLHDPPVTYHED